MTLLERKTNYAIFTDDGSRSVPLLESVVEGLAGGYCVGAVYPAVDRSGTGFHWPIESMNVQSVPKSGFSQSMGFAEADVKVWDLPTFAFDGYMPHSIYAAKALLPEFTHAVFVNDGRNVATDIYSSANIAGAIQAYLSGYPATVISFEHDKWKKFDHWDELSKLIWEIHNADPAPAIWSLNIPEKWDVAKAAPVPPGQVRRTTQVFVREGKIKMKDVDQFYRERRQNGDTDALAQNMVAATLLNGVLSISADAFNSHIIDVRK